MRVNEYGVLFYYGVSFDMSAYDNLSLAFTKPDGTLLTVNSPSVTINPSPVTTDKGTFSGNTYAIYRFVEGDINLAGAWTVRLTYTDGVQNLISQISNFTVYP